MIMAVYERTREIGILKAIGASPGDIRVLFMAEASFIGLLGGAGGLNRLPLLLFGLGIVLCVLIAVSFAHAFRGFCISGLTGV